MRIPGRKLVRRALRPLARRLAPGAVILGYHRVADAAWDPLGLAVGPAHFSEQVDVLKRLRRIVTLPALVRLQADGEPLERYAALTFDDGYDDFAGTVLPILETHGVPATVFVATGFTGKAFWWDEVAARLAPGAALDDELAIAHDGAAPWRYQGLSLPENRAAAARDLCNRLACSDDAEIRQALGQLEAAAAAGAETATSRGTSMSTSMGTAMTRAQLEVVARHPLVEVGAHTVSHGCLGKQSDARQQAEIGRSKVSVEALPGVSAAAVFSYPNGSFSARTPAFVRSLGFACACASREGTFRRSTDPYRMPRLWVPDAGAAAFRRWLGNWVAGAR